MKVLIAALLAFLLQASEQYPPASLQGFVRIAGTADPLSKVTLELRTVEGNAKTSFATTIDDGRFVFRNVPPGRYRLVATRTGYLPSEYGQRGPNGMGIPINLLSGQNATNVKLEMTPGSILHGHVYDSSGQPLVNASVQAMKVSYNRGRRRLKFVGTAVTNDLGEYRLFWLAPGTYYLSALHPDAGTYRPVDEAFETTLVHSFEGMMSSGRTFVVPRRVEAPRNTYVPVFFPETVDEEAARPIDLAAGADSGSWDIIVAPAQLHSVRGTIINTITGQAARNAKLFVSRYPARASDDPYTSVDSEKGVFEVGRVFPGIYDLVAIADDLIGRSQVQVSDADVMDVTITLSRGFRGWSRLSGYL